VFWSFWGKIICFWTILVVGIAVGAALFLSGLGGGFVGCATSFLEGSQWSGETYPAEQGCV
jgi:hypothetical protein